MSAARRGKVIGVIPARWGSTRFPGKSLAMLCGKPMVQWVFERARRAKRLDALLVATDDRRIRAAVERFGGRAVLTGKSHPSGTDRVAEAVRGTDAEIVINIQGDEPLIEPALIDRLAETLLADPDLDAATAATPITSASELKDPAVVKAVWGKDGDALYFSRSVIPFDREGRYDLAKLLYWRHLGIYAYRRRFLARFVASPPCALELVEKLEQLRALNMGARMKVIPARSWAPGVDTPADLRRTEKLMKKMKMD